MSIQQSTNACLLCDHCHGHGYEDTAAGKVACGECNPAVHDAIPGLSQSKVISSQRCFCFLSAGGKVVRIESDCLFSERRMFDLALTQFIEQKACKKLISQVRTDELVNGIMNTNLFHGHSEYCHDKPPKRLNGSESLAGPSADSSGLQHQILQREAANSRLLVNAPARFFLRRISRRRSVFEATRFIRFSHLRVYGKRPCPLAVFHSRKDVDDAAFVFESFHRFLVLVFGRCLTGSIATHYPKER